VRGEARTGRLGLLFATLLVLAAIIQPASQGAGSPNGSAFSGNASGTPAWQDALHTVQDQPRRLSASRHAPSTADTWWVVWEPAAAGAPPRARSAADAAGDAHRTSATPTSCSSRAPPSAVR
jgi:hypothetical protein